MESARLSAPIKTRLLILSDTHGMDFCSEDKVVQYADVLILCGDLTEESKLEEYRASIRLLKEIQAPLKLVIAGNHDFTLDTATFKHKIAEAKPPLEPDLVRKVYGEYGEASQILDDAKAVNIVFLEEGSHQFILDNGASLTVYASPWTLSLGAWAFQYPPGEKHDFAIEKGIDVVITHGPPEGIFDYTHSDQRAGCLGLSAAVNRARPRLHCFGHIHEG